MNDTLDLPDFSKYRYHVRRLWWLPVLLAVGFAFLAGGTSVIQASDTTSSATLVPTIPDATLFSPLTDFTTSAAVLQGDDVLETVEAQIGRVASATITIDPITHVVTIVAQETTAERARETRDAFVQQLLDARTQVIADSITRRAEELESEAAALQASLDAADEVLAAAPAESTAALLAGIDRAQISSDLLKAQRRAATLRALDPADRVDVRVESVSAEEGRKLSGGGLLLGIAGVIAGLFLGTLAVVTVAYLDEKVRARADLVTLGLPTFAAFDASAQQADAAALDAAVAVRHAASVTEPGPYRVGMLTFGEGAVPAVRQIEDALASLETPPVEVAVAGTPAERLRTAGRSDGVVLLLVPGVRLRDIQLEVQSLRRAGADVLGAALVAGSARLARRSG